MTAPVNFWSTQDHYGDHLRPIWEALPPELRGTWWPAHQRPPEGAVLTVVASASDSIALGRRSVVLVEHGAGQAYGVDSPSYSGGSKRDNVVLFLCPNEVSADRNRRRYPSVAIEVVGSPRLDALRALVQCDEDLLVEVNNDVQPVGLFDRSPRRVEVSHRIRNTVTGHGAVELGSSQLVRASSQRSKISTIALSHHWDCNLTPETRWASPHFWPAYRDVVEHFDVLGHGHPRYRAVFRNNWKRLGIEYVEHFEDLLGRAWVYVCDNSSSAFEWAALGRPIVWLSPPWYRRTVTAWPRFWRATEGLPHAEASEQLVAMIERAMDDPVEDQQARRALVDEVFPLRDGRAAERAAYAIAETAASLRSVT